MEIIEIMGIEAPTPKPSLRVPNKSHKIYPYLLRNLEVTGADQVWCADITEGHAYLVAIMQSRFQTKCR